MAGLNLYATQKWVENRLRNNLSQQVYNAGVMDAAKIYEENGDMKPIVVIQFTDMMPSSGDKMFCGPESDGYYTLARTLVLGPDGDTVNAVVTRVNQMLLGQQGPNMSPIQKDIGGGSWTSPSTNTKPSQAGVYLNFRWNINIEDVGSWE